MKRFILYLLLIVAPLSRAWAQPAHTASLIDSVHEQPKIFTVFLLGNAGLQNQPVTTGNLNLLRRQLNEVGEKGSIIFLGNTTSYADFPESDSAGRLTRPNPRQLLQTVKDFKGKSLFLPGNQEWDNGHKNGWQAVQNQEKLIEAYLQKGNVFLPDGGCPAPVEVPLTNQITLVVLNTQWWLHPWEKPAADSDCEVKDATELITQLEDILRRNQHKKIIVTGHHPMYSYGESGGYRPAKLHLFPLTDLNPNLYVPLPVVGSFYSFYHRAFGNVQDIPHPKYRVQRNGLVEIFKKYPNLVYANGHENSLQYIRQDSVHYITTGSGAATSYVRHKKKSNLLFGASQSGFSRLDYLTNGEVWLTFWTGGANQKEGTLVYQEKISKSSTWAAPAMVAVDAPLHDSVITISASKDYGAGGFHRKLLGNNYRAIWQQPVTVPVFDIDQVKGGLTVLKRGGGMQTKSLRLQAKDGRQYVLRSVDKDTDGGIPKALRQTLAADVVQDQISATHPYGALLMPVLSEAAGVFSTNPRLVYVPDDPRLGKYQALFANTLSILEERPEETDTLEPNEKVYSTAKMLEKLAADNDNQVNQTEVLRARLLDMVIGDWDRHDDQWRWSGKKQPGGTTFTPLPRDRDQVFFVNQGLIPNIVSRKWIMPKFQGFEHDLRDVPGFNFNARYFDRSFLNNLSLADWLAMADTLQTRLTDQVIAQAVGEWPTAVQDLSGPEVIAKLKSHRNNLKNYAQTYYAFLAREVDITGSDKKEFFHLKRLNQEETELRVYKINKEQEVKELLYHRIFKNNETKEVRLYGLGGDDKFQVAGNVSKSLKVRLIGGPGTDTFVDSSRVKGHSRQTVVYDSKEGNTLTLNEESKDQTSFKKSDNEYDRKAFQYNYLGPLASVQYNPDNGVFLGAGVLYRTHGFRKTPFATSHRLTANYAFGTSGFNVDYRGQFTGIMPGWDMEVNMAFKGPNFVNNFFGYGNETKYNEDEQDISFYRARVRSFKINTLFIKNLVGNQKIYIGPAYETYRVENTPNRFISQTEENESTGTSIFKRKDYAGLKLGLQFDNRDNKFLPTNGTYWSLESGIFKGVNGPADDYAKLESELSLFWSFRLPARITLATRFGGGVNFGDYEFFQANTLGGLTNLRGYRQGRFTGKSSLYNNTELRLRLFSFRTYIFPASVGLLGFHDVGRVWVKGEDSNNWHNGAGGGIWLAPFNRAVISFMYGVSKEDKVPIVRVGFLF